MTPALFCAQTNIGTCKMSNLTVLLVCTLAILLYVDTSTAAVSEATCPSATEAEQTSCESIVNAVCDGTAMCKCKEGSTVDDSNNKCLLALEGDCSTGLECTTENAECTSGKCACKSDYKLSTGNTACEQKGLNDTCSDDIDCQNVKNAVCSSTTCSCADGYKADANGACLLTLGGKCTDNSQCHDQNAECVDTNNDNTVDTCNCKSGYKDDGAGTCIPDKKLEESCTDVKQCPANAVCETNCVCHSDYKADSDGNCVLKAVTDYECTADDASKCPDNAVCGTDNKCQCDEGYVEEGNLCSGAAATKAMIWMMFSILVIRLVDKLLV